jgi:hypothetical protein
LDTSWTLFRFWHRPQAPVSPLHREFFGKTEVKKALLRRAAPASGNAHRHRRTGRECGAVDHRSFCTPRSHLPCYLLLSGAGDSCARLSLSRTTSACDVVCPPPPPYPSLPMIIDLSVAGVISGSRAVLSPRVGEGGLKKKGLFSSAKKTTPAAAPATIPKRGGSGGSFLRGGLSRSR